MVSRTIKSKIVEFLARTAGAKVGWSVASAYWKAHGLQLISRSTMRVDFTRTLSTAGSMQRGVFVVVGGAVLGIIVAVVVAGAMEYFFQRFLKSGPPPTQVAWLEATLELEQTWSQENLYPISEDALEKEVERRTESDRMEIVMALEKLTKRVESLGVESNGGDGTTQPVSPVSRWTVSGIAATISSLQENLPPGQSLAFHYTDEQSAREIARKGIRTSSFGWHGGGVFFSTKSPVADFPDDDGRNFEEVWYTFRRNQLKCNYGDDLTDAHGNSRNDKVDCCVVVAIPTCIISNVGADRPDAVFVAKSVYPTYFPQENIKGIFRLKPEG